MIGEKMRKLFQKFKDIPLNPPLFLTIGFGILILCGGLILNLPIMTKSDESVGFINALFTAGSASCVTGLVVVNTGQYWNFWGQLVIITLIQIGGLGIMTLATLFPIVMRRRIGLASRQIIKEQLNVETMTGMVRLLKYVITFTFTIEAIAAIAMSTRFIPAYGLKDGIWASIFHSISAFCNAGFDITGDSIVPFQSDFVINFTIMALIVIGGLGFMVTQELLNIKHMRNLSVHARIVLIVTTILIVGGAAIFFLLEYNNPDTLMGQGLYTQVLESFFQSVITRTAGFYSVDISKIRDASAFLMIILMFIGGSPGSTAGGLKTTTFGILFLAMISVIRGEDETVVFNKHINNKTVIKALALVMISLMIVIGISFMLTITEEFKFIDILLEVVSAYATVGLTRGITPGLSDFAKVIITFTMYMGRVGPLTMAFAIGKKADVTKLRYPEANISVG